VPLCTALSSQCLNLRSIEPNDIDLVMLAQIGISPGVTVAVIIGTIYFNGEHVPTRNWPNLPSKQTEPAFRFLIGLFHASGQALDQQIYAASTKPDFHFWVKTCFYQKSAGLPELRAIRAGPSPNIRSTRRFHMVSIDRPYCTR